MNLENAFLPQRRRERQGPQRKSLIKHAHLFDKLMLIRNPLFLCDLCAFAPLR
jgi:hypothetical protein